LRRRAHTVPLVTKSAKFQLRQWSKPKGNGISSAPFFNLQFTNYC
jgi:hypothetical protein